MNEEQITLEQVTGNVSVNEDAVEPNQYFKVLKGNLNKLDQKKLQEQLNLIGEQIVLAKVVNQKAFLRKLAFTYETIIKEQELLVHGIEKFVYKDDVKNLIDKVKPVNSIKIIELDRYPRAIPLDNLKKIKEIKEKNIFDNFCVVFTDFTKEDYTTPEEKKWVEKNKDPVVFGYFRHEKTGIMHDRFYLVTDWEDEYCDLTFSKMIDKMSEVGTKNPEKTISQDTTYIRELVMSVKVDMENDTLSSRNEKQTKSFWERLTKWSTKK